MLKSQTKSIVLSIAAITSLFLVGCGSSGSSETSTTAITGQLIDSYVQGANYNCEDGTSAKTDLNGEFSCKSFPISFSIGSVKLGEITQLALDKHVFPQDLVGVDRKDIDNPQAIAIAQLLQSLDSDNNPENGITLDADVISKMPQTDDFKEEDLDVYLEYAEVSTVEINKAKEHLQGSMDSLKTITDSILPVNITDSLTSVKYTLTEEVKNELAYMGNEERLAFDVYNKLYESFPSLKQLEIIPKNSEIKHIEAVRALIAKYEIDGRTLSVVDAENELLTPDAKVEDVAGIYDIQAIQDLYDMLIAQGEQSEVDALQVGCIIEVVDINDLDKFLQNTIETTQAQDVIEVFEFLREGSYSHYWAFDEGLKNLSITDGCCSLGDEYCKTEEEYPKADHGTGDNSTTTGMQGNGQQHGRN